MEKLLALRKNKGLTQKEVAEYLGISRQAYANYETGNREPDVNTLKKLSELFNVSIDVIFENQQNVKTDEQDIKVALFGGEGEVTDEMWDDVKKYVEFLKTKHKK